MCKKGKYHNKQLTMLHDSWCSTILGRSIMEREETRERTSIHVEREDGRRGSADRPEQFILEAAAQMATDG
jgi:hypothetical protein